MVSVLQRLVTAQNKSTEVQRMRALSDQQLAQMGMTRTDIVRNAYRNFSVT